MNQSGQITKNGGLEGPQLVTHASKSVNFTLRATLWLPDGSPRFVVLGENSRGKGILQVYQLCGTGVELVREREIEDPFRCASFGASPSQNCLMATGSFNGCVATWDIDSDLKRPVSFVENAHSSIINCLDGCAGDHDKYGPPEIATGGLDGCVRVWDIRNLQKTVFTVSPMTEESIRDCWAVSFGNSFDQKERHLAAGYDNGDLKIYDLKTGEMYYEDNLENGICGLQYDRYNILANKLVIGALEGNLYTYDMRTKHSERGFAKMAQKATLTDETGTVWCVKHLPQNRDIVAVTSGSGLIAIYHYQYPDSRSKKSSNNESEGVMGTMQMLHCSRVSEQPVPMLDWAKDKCGVAVFPAYDQNIRVVSVTKL